MIFIETGLKGSFTIELEKMEDDRGFFARSFCRKEFEARGMKPDIVQCNISFNSRKGTLRGMHYQAKPHEEVKVVRCTKGSIYDVIVDLRRDSPTFQKWYSIELSEINRKMIYVPKGFAHGFQTLEDNCEVFYQMSEFFDPECVRGARWDDPAFGIEWPEDNRIIADKDLEFRLIGQ